ncbi:CTP synthetase [Maritimibacter fusiformis]|uniref:CTP synthetase n=2 Tax=Maritimibacter fusiformis TaxID=2603819 RepID=A0A5D0RIM0_9RHOB|nr:CTP synthetase [Maritimibacter fusiformis]
MIGSTLAAVGVVAALVAGITGPWPLLGAALAGYVVGWPVAMVVAGRMR